MIETGSANVLDFKKCVEAVKKNLTLFKNDISFELANAVFQCK